MRWRGGLRDDKVIVDICHYSLIGMEIFFAYGENLV